MASTQDPGDEKDSSTSTSHGRARGATLPSTAAQDWQPLDRTRSRTTPVAQDDGSATGIKGRNYKPSTSSAKSPQGGHGGHGGGSVRRRGSTLSKLTSRDAGLDGPAATRADTIRTFHEPDQHHPNWQPGAEPGIDPSVEHHDDLPHLQALKAECDINIIDFGAAEGELVISHANNASLEAALAKPRPSFPHARWISVNGLSWDVVRLLGNKFDLHRLAIEDLVNTHSRTKVDWYREHACIILTLQKLVRVHRDDGDEDCPMFDGPEDDKGVDSQRNANGNERTWKRWWSRSKPPTTSDGKQVLPYYLDRDGNGKVDETIPAHSGTSENSPIQEIRTLHRYESSQIPAHTAFMEKHSVLAEEGLVVSVEQVCIFLLCSENIVISFFEHSADDVEAPILQRLRSTETILRRTCDTSLLMQAVVDAIVDLAQPVKDAYNKARKELQVDAMTNPNIRTSRALHIFGEEIDMLQNLFRPIVHLVNALRDHTSESPAATGDPASAGGNGDSDSHGSRERHRHRDRDRGRKPRLKKNKTTAVTNVVISPIAHVYLGDVLDHCISTIQAFEQMDASAGNITSLIFNTVGARTNNFMMILALVTVLFAPLTFISGYFGQNFSRGEGLDHSFSFFWVVSIPSLVVFMLLVFATMVWDNISDWLAKRGIRAHRKRRSKRWQ